MKIHTLKQLTALGLLASMLTLAGCGNEARDGTDNAPPPDVIVDTDGDGIPDEFDNCPAVSNQTQSDIDSDGIGDACDDDKDGDNISNNDDNCPLVANPNQLDSNANGIGDACDDDTIVDTDGDGIPDNIDNCPIVANASQSDIDNDGIGDACDTDIDGDNIPNSNDNCQTVANPDQADADGDGLGDVCDPDIDGDTINNEQDNCPTVANTSQRDTFGDPEVGDACESAGLIDVVESVVSNLSDETAIQPVRELVAALASANPEEPGALAAITGPLNDLSNTETGPLGPLSELVQGLVATEEEGLEPLIAGLNAIIGGLQNDPAATPQELSDLLLGLPDILMGLAGVFGDLAPPEFPFP